MNQTQFIYLGIFLVGIASALVYMIAQADAHANLCVNFCNQTYNAPASYDSFSCTCIKQNATNFVELCKWLTSQNLSMQGVTCNH